ncbi:MAG: MSMEG_0565 family glycosyltransferase, partial [Pseudonocardiaceae bacterium]
MEALAAGVPLVVSNLPVLREIFSGAARFATDPDELATHLMAALTVPDPTARDTGRALTARHTWSTAAQRHLELYRRR